MTTLVEERIHLNGWMAERMASRIYTVNPALGSAVVVVNTAQTVREVAP